MASPAFDDALHDVGLNGIGYVRDPSAALHRDDAEPATARSAQGEGRYDSYQDDSYLAQADFSGGVGQGRLRSGDALLSGIGDGRNPGSFFPAKKRIASANNGGTTYEMLERLGVLYGMTATQIEQIESNTVQAITSGIQLCKPEVTAANNVVWVADESGTQKVRRWNGSAIADVTPPNVVPYLVKLYNRFLWSFGQRTLPSTPTLVQQARSTTTSAAKSRAATWTQPTAGGSTLLLSATAYPNAGTTVPTLTPPAGWTEVPNGSVSDTGAPYARTQVWYIESAPSQSGAVTVTSDITSYMAVNLVEFSGMLLSGVVDVADTSVGTTTMVSASIDTTNAKSYLWLAGYSDEGGAVSRSVSSFSNSFTEGQDFTFDNSLSFGLGAFTAYRQVSSTGTYTTTATFSGSVVHTQSVLVALSAYNISTDLTQTTVHYTLDDGSTWNEAFQGDSAGIPVPRAGVAAEGFLWLTTDRKLYRMGVTETAFDSDPLDPVLTVAFGEVDKWDVPKDTGVVGRQIDVSERVIYWGVGGTVRQFAPNGEGRQLWPPADWATQAGAVQGLTSGEGGVYFGAGGYLYNYNGRGFHCLAKETTAGEFDYLKWHNGRLYVKSDPGAYYDFQYPSMRPDIVLTDATTFTAGYAVTSLIDHEKASIDKVVRRFQLQGYFTAGSTTAETGNLKLEYYAGDSLPDKLGGGATSLTWTNIGSLGGSDGAFFKDFTLGTPLVKKRYWLRVTLTPGTLGYPVLTALVADGRALMPAVKRFILPLSISTATRNRAGGRMYPTAADVKTAIDELLALRPGTYFTLKYVSGPDNSTTDYVCTSEQMLENINGMWHDNSISELIQFVAKETP